MAITSLFLAPFTRTENSNGGYKRNRIRRYFEICGKVSNSQGSKRRLIIIEKPNKALNEKLTTRKCSQCRQQGHNSRTCKETYEVNTLWKNPHSENSREDRLNSFGDTVCERCNDAGVVSCVFCEQNFARNKDTNAFETTQVDTPGRLDSFKERQLKTTTYLANLGRLSKMTYRLDGKTKVEVCVKCSGTTLMQSDDEEEQILRGEGSQNIYGLGSFEYTGSSSLEQDSNKRQTTFWGKLSRSLQDSWKQFSQGLMEVSQKKSLKYPIILFFGDSLTEYSQHVSGSEGVGWGALMTSLYSSKAEVVIRGFAGYNTRWAFYMLPKVLNALDLSCLKLVVIFLGANDCTLPESPQHVGVEEYASNLFKMIRLVHNLQSQGAKAELLLVTPPPLIQEMWEDDCRQKNKPVLREASRVEEYVNACKRVAEEAHIPCLDLWNSIQQQMQWSTFFTDGLHFADKGNAYVFEQLKAAISDNFPKLKAENMRPVFPHWSEIDPTNFTDTFDNFFANS